MQQWSNLQASIQRKPTEEVKGQRSQQCEGSEVKGEGIKVRAKEGEDVIKGVGDVTWILSI